MSIYDHKKIEKKWQDEWEKSGIYKTSEDKGKKKCYVLDMFPYPSGEGLHVGHPKGYIATDIYSRFKKMNGFNVLHPMGWDAFGLPAENYAIKNKVQPRIAVEKNIKRFKEQLSILGFNYDWDREINTTDPEYYRWTQWIFLKLYEKGLAEERFEPINWCPVDKTGLANEDIENGRCERCGAIVEKRMMRQWVLKITDYAERMLADLDVKDKDDKPLLDWPESIKESQRNWIGRSEGSEIDFNLTFKKNPDDRRGPDGKPAHLSVFTTRPDTLFGVTYIVISPEHLWITLATDDNHDVLLNKDEVKAYAESAKNKTEIDRTATGKEKTGVEIKGVMAINPASGEEVPIYVVDYVIANYGTGVVMAVPAHDDRDFEFAKKYNLPIKEVIVPNRIDHNNPPREGKQSVTRENVHAIVRDPKTDKYLVLKWKKQPWITFPMGGVEEGEDIVEAARREVKEETGFSNLKFIKVLGGSVRAEYFAAHKDQNRVAFTKAVMFDLIDDSKEEVTSEEDRDAYDQDWFSKSEIVYPKVVHAELSDWLSRWDKIDGAYTGEGMLINSGKFDGMESRDAKKSITDFAKGKITVKYKLKDWVFSRQRYWGEPIPMIHCEKDGIVPVHESDLPVRLPEVENYEPTDTGESPLADIADWVNITCPKCGGPAKRETNTMPQWAGSSWYYLRYIDPKNNSELVSKEKEKAWMPVDMYVGGAEHATRHLIYARFWHKFLFDIGIVHEIEPFKGLRNQGLILAEDGKKMSKRYGNVINPDDMVEIYGADTLRIYEMFMGPFDQSISWSTQNMIGSRRFVERIWKIKEKVQEGVASESNIESMLNQTIQKVSCDIEDFKFNTAISSTMILLNMLDESEEISQSVYEKLLIIVAPFAPHIAEELWSELGNKNSIHLEKWPVADSSKIISGKKTVVIQVDGKVRGEFEIENDIADDFAKKTALQNEKIKQWIDGKSVEKVIYIKGKLVSIVTKKEQ